MTPPNTIPNTRPELIETVWRDYLFCLQCFPYVHQIMPYMEEKYEMTEEEKQVINNRALNELTRLIDEVYNT